MKIKAKYFTLLFTSFIVGSIFSQGFTFDKESYAEREVVENNRSYMPLSVSLKKYAPIIYPQEVSNCVAQSYANALNILVAKEKGLTDKSDITLYRPSPFFIYYSNKSSSDYKCEQGLDAEKVALFLLSKGVLPMLGVEYPNYYPFSEKILCGTYPPSYQDDANTALAFKPSNIYKIENLLDIKVALANGMPVVIGMLVPNSFINCNSYIWSPSSFDNIQNSYKHAMTIVGYDDNLYGGSFEIMNSWGEDWGINGYTRIRYKDALNWIMAGWAVEKKQAKSIYRFEGDFKKKDDNLTPSSEYVKIFSEARNDTLMVNPFFQREDLKDVFLKLNE